MHSEYEFSPFRFQTLTKSHSCKCLGATFWETCYAISYANTAWQAHKFFTPGLMRDLQTILVLTKLLEVNLFYQTCC